MNPRYQEWLKHIFDHEVNDHLPAWYYNLDDKESTSFEAPAAELVFLINQTFRSSGTDLLAYSDAQVNQGLWYLIEPGFSEYIFALKSAKVPLSERVQAIDNTYYLYADCFAKRCAETLGHLSEEGSPLNSICYMFWDTCPITYLEDVPDKTEIENAIFRVLERSLKINHKACQEGALHGLGHMFYSNGSSAESIVTRFLEGAKPDQSIAEYANNAMKGNVL